MRELLTNINGALLDAKFFLIGALVLHLGGRWLARKGHTAIASLDHLSDDGKLHLHTKVQRTQRHSQQVAAFVAFFGVAHALFNIGTPETATSAEHLTRPAASSDQQQSRPVQSNPYGIPD